jgi:hypothetical protein
LDIGHVAFDPKTPVVDESAFNNGADWKEFYGEVQEELLPKMPKPQGQRVTISAFVDANHARNKVTRCSQGPFKIINVQQLPINGTILIQQSPTSVEHVYICQLLPFFEHYN